MAYRRTSIGWFAIANRAYTNAQVAFYRVDPITKARLGTLVTLYDSPSANTTQANPVTLDGDGKFSIPLYVDEPVIGIVSGSEVGAHETGVLYPLQRSFRGVWQTATVYYPDDLVREPGGGYDVYACTTGHTSGVWLTDKPSKWTLYAAIGVAVTSANAAALSEANAATSATNAAGSATAAAGSATSASGSVTAAAGSATAAAGSATAAAGSATAASNSATAAAGSASAAAISAASIANGPVTSVNSLTGAVTLTAASVGAVSTSATIDLAHGGTGSTTAANARTALGLGALATLAAADLAGATTTGTLGLAKGGTGGTDAATARTGLGLGALATLAAADLAGATTTGTLGLTKGGTGAASAAAALTSLGALPSASPVLADYRLTASNLGAGVAINTSTANYFYKTVSGATTFTFATSATTGTQATGFILELTNGGSATVTWPTSVKWPSGTAPSLTASGVDVLAFISDDAGTVWRGVLSQKDSK
jgi:hypothetical protein